MAIASAMVVVVMVVADGGALGAGHAGLLLCSRAQYGRKRHRIATVDASDHGDDTYKRVSNQSSKCGIEDVE